MWLKLLHNSMIMFKILSWPHITKVVKLIHLACAKGPEFQSMPK